MYRAKALTLFTAIFSVFVAREASADLTSQWIFIDRFDASPYSPTTINNFMQNAANQGFTDVVFQVRGRADAFYNGSIYEPKATAVGSFDPLATAVSAAHSHGMKLHAWMNSLPLWNLAAAPSSSTVQNPALHPYNAVPNPTAANPGYRVIDINGIPEPGDGYSTYAVFNPILQASHDHINNVARDIATRYDVDGIHLDYIRYAAGTNFNTLPHDDLSHQMFFNATGLNGSNPANATAYRSFVMGRITDLVASIKDTVDAAEVSEGRTIELSASVWRDPDVGKNDYLQDYRTWLQQDLVDVANPMIYLSASNDATYFNANLNNTLNVATNARIAPTVASYLHTASGGGDVALTLGEIQRAYEFGADGVGFYDYPAFFNTYSSSERQRIKNFLDSPTSPGNVIDNFETDEGHFGWNYNDSPQTTGLSGATTIQRVTNQAQSGGGSQLLDLKIDAAGNSSWTLQHNSGIGTMSVPAGNIAMLANGYVGFWLKTTNSGIAVKLGIDDGSTELEAGYVQNVIADNQWHLYQWNLVDDARWDNYSNGDGNIDAYLVNGNVTIDSIIFSGNGNAQIYLDTVSHNFNGLLAAAERVPGDYNASGTVDLTDYNAWHGAFGQNVAAGIGADGNGSSVVDAADYVMWRKLFGGGGGASASESLVPEPAGVSLVMCLFVVVACYHRIGERVCSRTAYR